MKKKIIPVLLCALCACGSSDDDMSKPVISDKGIVAMPTDCQVYHRGDIIPFHYVFTDDTELGNYNIEIHHNFDHHTHGTTATVCEMDEKKAPVNAWIFNNDYEIPTGQTTYNSRLDIRIPDDIDTGDYHFSIRVTDRAGWQEMKALSIKIVE